jgi:hypothetical protein
MGDDSVTITRRWLLSWGPATSALLEVAALYGVTLEQAALGRLRERLTQAPESSLSLLDVLVAAAETGLTDFAWTLTRRVAQAAETQGSLTETVLTIDVFDRLGRGHIPGFEPTELQQSDLRDELIPPLIGAAVRQIDGLIGSDRLEDAQALLSLVQRERTTGSQPVGDTRIRHALNRLAEEGSPLMQGAAGGLRVMLGYDTATALGQRLGSWVDAASTASAQPALAMRLRGALLVAAPILQASPETTAALIERVSALDSQAFLRRLPALRHGFEVLSPADRHRFMSALPLRGDAVDLRLDYPAQLLSAFAEADQHGRTAVEQLDHEVLGWTPTS